MQSLLWDATKTMLKGECAVVSVYIKMEFKKKKDLKEMI